MLPVSPRQKQQHHHQQHGIDTDDLKSPLRIITPLSPRATILHHDGPRHNSSTSSSSRGDANNNNNTDKECNGVLLEESTARCKLPLSSPPLLLATPPRRPKKTVTFNPNSRAKRSLHLNNYTNEEKDATWYSRAELNEVRREARFDVQTISVRGEANLDEEQYCLRGIEFLTLEGAKNKMESKMAGWDAVFDEQDLQQEDETIDLDMLSLVYFNASYQCQVAAYERARCDQQAVSVTAGADQEDISQVARIPSTNDDVNDNNNNNSGCLQSMPKQLRRFSNPAA